MVPFFIPARSVVRALGLLSSILLCHPRMCRTGYWPESHHNYTQGILQSGIYLSWGLLEQLSDHTSCILWIGFRRAQDCRLLRFCQEWLQSLNLPEVGKTAKKPGKQGMSMGSDKVFRMMSLMSW